MTSTFTQSDALVEVARNLAARSHDGVFSWEQLCVAAHEQFSGMFALQGFPELVDSNKISSLLVAGRGPLASGAIERAGQKFYRLGASNASDR